jgi:hypothetical protein
MTQSHVHQLPFKIATSPDLGHASKLEFDRQEKARAGATMTTLGMQEHYSKRLRESLEG